MNQNNGNVQLNLVRNEFNNSVKVKSFWEKQKKSLGLILEDLEVFSMMAS